MKTLPLKKQFAPFYRTSTSRIELLQLPALQFLMIDGVIEKGSEPGKSPRFAAATQALYSVAYTLKFMVKKRKVNAFDYPVMPLASVRLAKLKEGLCVQATHVGPYATEPATIERMQAFMAANKVQDNVGPKGKHHEIYLGDPRRTAPAKLKTLLRHPVVKVR